MTQTAGISRRCLSSRIAHAGTARRLIPALLLLAATLAIAPLAAA